MDNSAQSGPIDPNLVRAAQAVPHQVGLVKLSKTQLRVLDLVNEGELVGAIEVAKRADLSPSWCSTTLKRIWEKGYVSRRSVKRMNGGFEYVYLKF